RPLPTSLDFWKESSQRMHSVIPNRFLLRFALDFDIWLFLYVLILVSFRLLAITSRRLLRLILAFNQLVRVLVFIIVIVIFFILFIVLALVAMGAGIGFNFHFVIIIIIISSSSSLWF